MSFALDTKASLVVFSEGLKHDCCRRAELYGILSMAGVFSRQKCKLVTTSEELANLTMKWLSSLYGIAGNLYITERKSGDVDERRSCKITIPQKKDLERLFNSFCYKADDPLTQIKREMLRCAGCEPSFVRGAFLSSGTLINPDKGYHLEMSIPSIELADSFATLLAEAGFEPKRMIRKNENVLYYKDSEDIENFLAYIGANTAAFTIMNKKIEREIRSDANRITNGELANIGKAIAASTDQINAINSLIASGELTRMPEELQKTAYLRLENRSATLSQLAELHNPPITKSGVNHRLKKIMEWNK
jgi:DNA-binding protein WhiA